ncbi:MAG: hypothetical protein N3G21_00685 [Candidatus Hydrogenedentes bacterium]|nr:hypothetical protein [Candidatus Hydrogenedentota bacterium]
MVTKKYPILSILILILTIFVLPYNLISFNSGYANADDNLTKDLNKAERNYNLPLQEEDPNIALSSPFENRIISVPEDVYNPSKLKVYLPVHADSEEPSNDTITFTACQNPEPCPDENSVYSDTILIPGYDFINISSFLNPNYSSVNLFIRGLLNANFEGGGGVVYERITPLSETITIELQKVSPSTDNDKNGIPENIGTLIMSGGVWFSNQLKRDSLRSIIITPLNFDGDKLILKLTEDILIEIPTYNSLSENDLLLSENSLPFAIISLTKEYSALIDIVSGSSNLTEWLNNISNTAPGLTIDNLPFVSVFLLQVNELGDISPISLEDSAISLTLSISSPFQDQTTPIGIFTYPAKVLGQYLTNDPTKPDIWKKVDYSTYDNSIKINYKGNCILSIFKLLLRVSKVSPSRIAVNTPTPLTLEGIIPVTEPKTIEEAESLYEVRIGGNKADFRSGDAENEDIAITPYIPDTKNQMFIISPAISQSGKADLEVIDKLVEGYSFTLPDAIQVLNVYTVSANISRTDNSLSPNAKITLNPLSSQELNQPNKFFEGDEVVLSISELDENTYFLGWFTPTGNLLSTQQTILLEVGNNITVTAKLTKNQDYTININVDPPNGGTVTLDPEQESYPPGTSVKLTAIPNSNYIFDKWLLPNGQTSTTNPLTITVDKDYVITSVFKKKPVELSSILPFEYSEFIPDEQNNRRLAVWIFGGVVCEISGVNLSPETELQLIDSDTGETLLSNLKPIECSSDGSRAKIIVPAYPKYSDNMPAYIDTDLKYEGFTIPAFRYYHFRTDSNGITYTAFIANNLSSPQKITLHLESPNKYGELNLPAFSNITQNSGAGIVRTMILIDNPTPSASAIFFGNTLINADIYGYPITGMYETSVHIYQPISSIDNLNPGAPTYQPAKDSNGNPLLIKSKYPYKLDGTIDSNAQPIKIKLPANDLDYNYFRQGISVFGQSLDFDYITKQVKPGKITAFQSQILSTDLEPALTETIQGPAEFLTMRVYSLNGFGIRMSSLLPFQTTSLIRLNSENGILESPIEGDVEATIVSPQGGLAYIDRIIITNPNSGYKISLPITEERGIDEGFLKFKTPKSQETGIMNILLYSRGNPFTPTVTLTNILVYSKPPERLDYLWLIPTGMIAIILGAVGEGTSGGGPCFIATAAYGTPLAEEINVLRAIRDNFMLTNVAGTAFVEFYYNISPPIAEFVGQHPFVATLIRIFLIPLVTAGKIILAFPNLIKIGGTLITLYLILKKMLRYFAIKT